MTNPAQLSASIFNRILRMTVLALALLCMQTVVGLQPAQAQTYQVIYDFTGGRGGEGPEAGVTMDRAGNLYGTTGGGGINGGVVYELSHRGSSWVLTPLYAFSGENDGAGPAARVVFGPDGVLYGTTYGGGLRGCNTGGGCGIVFSLRPPTTFCRTVLCPWSETVLYRFTGGVDGGNPGYGDLVFDQAGNIYGTTEWGGSANRGVVYKLSLSGGGWTETVLHSFGGGSDGQGPLGGVIFDTLGNLYGTTFSGGTIGGGTVYELISSGSSWIENILDNLGTYGHGSVGSLLFDASGDLYGTTIYTGNGSGGTAFQLTPSAGGWTENLLYSFSAGNGGGPYCPLTMDAAGDLYGTTITDGADDLGTVFKLTHSGSNWIETDLHDFTGFRGGDGQYPYSNVIFDAHGNLYGTASSGGSQDGGVVWEITP